MAPDGRHAYVVNQGDEPISTYDVDAAGALTFASSVATGAGPVQIALSPDGASAYVTNFTDGTVSQYDVTAAGALSPKHARRRRGRADSRRASPSAPMAPAST